MQTYLVWDQRFLTALWGVPELKDKKAMLRDTEIQSDPTLGSTFLRCYTTILGLHTAEEMEALPQAKLALSVSPARCEFLNAEPRVLKAHP